MPQEDDLFLKQATEKRNTGLETFGLAPKNCKWVLALRIRGDGRFVSREGEVSRRGWR